MRDRALCWVGIPGACLAFVSAGCLSPGYHSESTSTRLRDAWWRWNLNECQEVRLSCDFVRDRTSGHPERKYEQFVLRVNPRRHLRFERTLKTVELVRGARRGQIRFEEIEARTDDTHQKVWFVESETGRILATLDRATGNTTGPDDPAPAWATQDGGVPLESISD